MQTILNFLKHEYPAQFHIKELSCEMSYTLDDILMMLEHYYNDGDIEINGFKVAAKNPLTQEEAANYKESEIEYIEVLDD